MRQTAFCVFVSVMLLSACPVYAQVGRAWVSAGGDDINPCTFTAPCATFMGAISKTIPNGFINASTSGVYGGLTIQKGVTVDGSEYFAGVLLDPAWDAGITIDAPGATVVLRNLDISGAGANGIRIISAAHVSIENCKISNYTHSGIRDERGSGTLNVIGCDIRNPAPGAIDATGIRQYSASSAETVIITIARTHIAAQAWAGIEITRARKVLISDTRISNSQLGVIASSSAVSIADCTLMGNQIGVRVIAGTARIGGTTITGSERAFFIDPGLSVISFGNNRIDGNTLENGDSLTNVGVQ